MENTSKITYVSAINSVLTAINNNDLSPITAEVVEKLVALGQSLEKRNASKSNKPTKKQAANTEIKVKILTALANGPAKCGDIATTVGISGQQCSALLSQLVKEGQVIKTVEKRVSIFSLSEADE